MPSEVSLDWSMPSEVSLAKGFWPGSTIRRHSPVSSRSEEMPSELRYVGALARRELLRGAFSLLEPGLLVTHLLNSLTHSLTHLLTPEQQALLASLRSQRPRAGSEARQSSGSWTQPWFQLQFVLYGTHINPCCLVQHVELNGVSEQMQMLALVELLWTWT